MKTNYNTIQHFIIEKRDFCINSSYILCDLTNDDFPLGDIVDFTNANIKLGLIGFEPKHTGMRNFSYYFDTEENLIKFQMKYL